MRGDARALSSLATWCTSLAVPRPIRPVRSAHPADWAAQFDICQEGIEEALAMAGAILNDVIQRRSFTIASAEQNRPYGKGPAWFKDSWRSRWTVRSAWPRLTAPVC